MGRRKKLLQTVGERVLKNFNFLKRLCKTHSEKKWKNQIKNANTEELLALTEISSNILAGRFSLTKKQREKLLPFANYIRKIARVRSEQGAKKIFVNQQGGQAVLAALLSPILVEAAQHLISKITQNG
jgi:superfamily I DNA/RNA helicase